MLDQNCRKELKAKIIVTNIVFMVMNRVKLGEWYMVDGGGYV